LACHFGLRAFFRPFFAVEHIGTRDFVMLIAHEREFYLVLDFFYVEGATGIGTACQSSGNLPGQLLDDFMHTTRGRGASAFDCKKSLRNCDRDLVLIKWCDSAVPTNNLKGWFSGDDAFASVALRQVRRCFCRMIKLDMQ
jgi:hypothetical protein